MIKEYAYFTDLEKHPYKMSEIYLIVSHTIWDDNIAENYMKKYWLSNDEYEKKWKKKQEVMFINPFQGIPDIFFNSDYQVIIRRGGGIFSREGYTQFINTLEELGNNSFVIIENTFNNLMERPRIQLKFSIKDSWEDINSGNYISEMIFDSCYGDYFVIANSGNFGKYAANECKDPTQLPIYLIGVKNNLNCMLKEYSISPIEKKEIINNWIPESYKNKIIW